MLVVLLFSLLVFFAVEFVRVFSVFFYVRLVWVFPIVVTFEEEFFFSSLAWFFFSVLFCLFFSGCLFFGLLVVCLVRIS